MTENGNIILYQSDDGDTKVDVVLKDETVWLTQAQMAQLFQSDQSNIARHIGNIYQTSELLIDSTMQKLHNAQSSKPIQYYNLDMIISVGYRVNSH